MRPSKPIEWKTCPTCGKHFSTYGQRRPEKVHCSLACSNEARHRAAQAHRFTIRCSVCGKKISVSQSRRSTKTCSRKCKGKTDRKVPNRPTLRQLLDLLERGTLKQIGKLYGVSATTIKYWILVQGGSIELEIRKKRKEREKYERSYAKSGKKVSNRLDTTASNE